MRRRRRALKRRYGRALPLFVPAALARYGRAVSRRELLKRFEVERIRLNSQGYDRHGVYYGTGEPLFRVWDDDTRKDHVVRAASAEEARAKAIAYWLKHGNYSGEYGRRVWSPFAETVEESYYGRYR